MPPPGLLRPLPRGWPPPCSRSLGAALFTVGHPHQLLGKQGRHLLALVFVGAVCFPPAHSPRTRPHRRGRAILCSRRPAPTSRLAAGVCGAHAARARWPDFLSSTCSHKVCWLAFSLSAVRNCGAIGSRCRCAFPSQGSNTGDVGAGEQHASNGMGKQGSFMVIGSGIGIRGSFCSCSLPHHPAYGSAPGGSSS